jgi:diguanylate cyclase (GGDEF)-like protein/hemerythrin-like metal-binding protein/PAS domain S-box-containing protein
MILSSDIRIGQAMQTSSSIKNGRPKQWRIHFLLALITISLSLTLQAAPLEKITLQLRWFHQFQFAGYYAAQMKGYYRDAGLDVRILDSKPGMEVVNEVVSERAQYGVGNSSLLLARQQGKPVVAIATIFQHSPLVYIARADANISSVHDLIGKKIMLEPHADELIAYLKKEGVTREKLKLLPYSFDFGDLIDGKVDAISAFSSDELYYLDKNGFRYLMFTPRSAGIDFYGDNLFTTQHEIINNPERVKAFRAASIKGWVYAMQHPDEIADIIISHYGYRDEKAHLLYEAKNMIPLLGHDNVELGYMYAGRWQHIADTYAELGLMPDDFSLDGFLYRPEPEKTDLTHLYIAIFIAVLVCSLCISIAFIFIRLNKKLTDESKARQAAIEDMQESERNLRFITDNSADVMWTMDITSGKFTYMSPSVYQLRGFTVDEVMNQSLNEVMSPESLERALSALAESIARWQAGDRGDTRKVTEIDQPHKDGHMVSTEVVTTLHADEHGQLTSIIGITRDISERKKAEEVIRNMAFYDSLTKLPNRRLLLDRLEQAITQAKRNESRLALMFIDLDKFKPVNDQYGHEAGDWLLKAVAQRMQTCLRETDTAARIGGDEFIVLLPEIRRSRDAIAVAEKIRDVLNQPFEMSAGKLLNISACIGIAIYPEHGLTEKQLMKNGDTAMYQAKESGRNRVWVYKRNQDNSILTEDALVLLNWKKSYESGNPSIDMEHRGLFELASELINSAIRRDENPEAFEATFETLLEFTERHFLEEEAILAQFQYENFAEHVQSHRDLIHRAHDLHQAAIHRQMSMGDLINFIIEDLVKGHMFKSDRKIYPLLKASK